MAVANTPANQHNNQPFIDLIGNAAVNKDTRVHADKAYASKKHREALKANGLIYGIKDKAVKNKPLSTRQRKRKRSISKVCYVVEHTLGNHRLFTLTETNQPNKGLVNDG
jgi:IS5 family transposase